MYIGCLIGWHIESSKVWKSQVLDCETDLSTTGPLVWDIKGKVDVESNANKS